MKANRLEEERIRDFFRENKAEISDGGFVKRVHEHLPTHVYSRLMLCGGLLLGIVFCMLLLDANAMFHSLLWLLGNISHWMSVPLTVWVTGAMFIAALLAGIYALLQIAGYDTGSRDFTPDKSNI